MSSQTSTTRTGGADDFYGTPPWVTRAILPHLGPLAGLRIADTSAGRGAILRELLAAGAAPEQMMAIELDPSRAAVCRALGVSTIADDFFRVVSVPSTAAGMTAARSTDRAFMCRQDLIIMNPPFHSAQEHIEYALTLLAPGGSVVALTRLAFALTGLERAPFRAAHPFDVFPLASRPSFTAELLTWQTDAELLAQAREVKTKQVRSKRGTKTIPAHLETLAEVKARLKGSDSADYCWCIFSGPDALPRGGSFQVLEGRA